jgi:ubiquinone/menaquinone biosynthesis C-methylase UbiE
MLVQPPYGKIVGVPYLSAEQARRVYDRIGRLQDTQRVYEGRAVDALVAAGDFAGARAVVEVGCGTGALAARLLGHDLPATAQYVAVDLSPRMAAIARTRLAPFGERVTIRVGDAAERIPVDDGCADRVVSAYVFDLLSPERAAALLAEARRALAPDGLLCVVSLTQPHGTTGRVLFAGWERLWSLRPQLVGGCRPVDLLPLLDGAVWRVESARVETAFAISSQVVVARPA